MTARVLKAPAVVVTDAKALPPAAVREAIEEAFRQGREIGQAEGSRALDGELRSLRTSLLRTIDDLRAQMTATVERDALVVTELAMDLAGWFVGHVISSHPDLMRANIRGALGRLADETGLVLDLNPAVVAALGPDHGLGAVVVREDATLATGDYRLTGNATVLERRWADTMTELAADLAPLIDIARDEHHD